MGKQYPPEDPYHFNTIDSPLLLPYTRFWIDNSIPPEKIVGISMHWEFRPYNLQRVLDIRRYLYEKMQIGLLNRVLLMGVPKTNGDAHMVLEAMAPRAWVTLLRPGLLYYGHHKVRAQREIDGKDHIRLVIPLREEEYVTNSTTG